MLRRPQISCMEGVGNLLRNVEVTKLCEFMQRLFAALNGTLGSYLRDAL
jgi:hypothetical protein